MENVHKKRRHVVSSVRSVTSSLGRRPPCSSVGSNGSQPCVVPKPAPAAQSAAENVFKRPLRPCKATAVVRSVTPIGRFVVQCLPKLQNPPAETQCDQRTKVSSADLSSDPAPETTAAPSAKTETETEKFSDSDRSLQVEDLSETPAALPLEREISAPRLLKRTTQRKFFGDFLGCARDVSVPVSEPVSVPSTADTRLFGDDPAKGKTATYARRLRKAMPPPVVDAKKIQAAYDMDDDDLDKTPRPPAVTKVPAAVKTRCYKSVVKPQPKKGRSEKLASAVKPQRKSGRPKKLSTSGKPEKKRSPLPSPEKSDEDRLPSPEEPEKKRLRSPDKPEKKRLPPPENPEKKRSLLLSEKPNKKRLTSPERPEKIRPLLPSPEKNSPSHAVDNSVKSNSSTSSSLCDTLGVVRRLKEIVATRKHQAALSVLISPCTTFTDTESQLAVTEKVAADLEQVLVRLEAVSVEVLGAKQNRPPSADELTRIFNLMCKSDEEVRKQLRLLLPVVKTVISHNDQRSSLLNQLKVLLDKKRLPREERK